MFTDFASETMRAPVEQEVNKPASNLLRRGAASASFTETGDLYPRELWVQQVTRRVVRTVLNRIDEALVGGPIRLSQSILGESGKAHLRQYIREKLFPELFCDPVPLTTKPKTRIGSPKAMRLLDDRLEAAFATESVRLPGMMLGPQDCGDLIMLFREHILPELEEQFTSVKATDCEP